MSRLLVVDLNNFARFPTLPVGLIVAVLRNAGHEVEVVSPLAVGMTSLPRGMRAKPWGYWDERLRWWSATSHSRSVRGMRHWLEKKRAPDSDDSHVRVVEAVRSSLKGSKRGTIDAVLVSAYLMYERTVRAIGVECAGHAVPMVLGGPAFTQSGVQDAWLDTPGLTALVGAEVEPMLTELVNRVVSRENLDGLPGVATPTSGAVAGAPPLRDLDSIPFPDYSDFPWDRYPNRVVSMLATRGCGWGACSFCSDVLSANGRSFRARTAANVLSEVRHHYETYGVQLFCFSDLKLNSDVDLWRGLHAGFQDAAPGARWTCAVHVGAKGDQGLELTDLKNARSAGLVRITTGVETGSQRLLDNMRKGTSVEKTEAFLQNAAAAGISVRATMFTGFPGEDAGDVTATAVLLERAAGALERVSLSRFLILPGTPIHGSIDASPEAFPEIETMFGQARASEIHHLDSRYRKAEYKRALRRVLRAAHRINRKPLAEAARPLEGAM